MISDRDQGPQKGSVHGVLAWGSYVPHHRLKRSTITEIIGGGGSGGTRAVAGFDEDTTTMGVEAARGLVRNIPEGGDPEALLFATTEPAYMDKANATIVHAALGLPSNVAASDAIGSARSAILSLRSALLSVSNSLVVASDLRTGLPRSADERAGGDAAAAVLCGPGADPAATLIGHASATSEFLDRWRVLGESHTQMWEERFSETVYLELGEQAWVDALKDAGLVDHDVDKVAVSSVHPRALKAFSARRKESETTTVVDDLSSSVGHTGTAHPLLLLAGMLDQAEPGEVLALVSLVDGADVLVFRANESITARRPVPTLVAQTNAGDDSLAYPRFLEWRGMLRTEPARRPEPDRTAAPPSFRSQSWKFGFLGSRCTECDRLHLPPQRVCLECHSVDSMEREPMSDRRGRVVSFTIDRLAFTPSPPMVAGVIDLDGGGRIQCEFTDVDPDIVKVGMEMEVSFRRLFTAGGIHNYFWKARPARGAS